MCVVSCVILSLFFFLTSLLGLRAGFVSFVMCAAGLVVGSDTDTFKQDIQLPESLRRESSRAYTL